MRQPPPASVHHRHSGSRLVCALAGVAAASLLLGLVATPSVAVTATTIAVPGSIDATGAVDVTDQLNTFLQAVPDHAVVEFAPGGSYRIEGSLVVVDALDLTLDGNGATVFATTPGTRNRTQWYFAGGQQITVRDLTVRGANPSGGTSEAAWVPAYEAQHGFTFAGVRGLLLDGITVSDVYGDFVYLGSYVERNQWSTDVIIRNSRFERNGRQGIALTGAKNVLIENNYIGNTRRATFDLEPNGGTTGVTDVVIRNNVVGPGRLYFLAGIGTGPVDRLSVVDNVLQGRPLTLTLGNPGTSRSGLEISRNVSNVGVGNPGGAAINITGYDGVIVRNNVQWLQSGRDMAGVDVWESCRVDISGNDFTLGAYESRIRPFACPYGSPTSLTPPVSSPTPNPTPTVTLTATPTAPVTATLTASPTATAHPRPPRKQEPTLTRLTTRVKTFDVQEPATKGSWLTMSGRVLSYQPELGWSGLGGERVRVQFRAAGTTTYRTLGSVLTSWNGRVKVSRLVRAKQNGAWRLVLPKSTVLKRSAAQPDFVSVR